jgi:hypothetical protein
MGVEVLTGPEGARVDCASTAVDEEELRGVGVHVELVVWGDNFKSIIDDVLAEDGGPGLFVGVVELTKPRVDAWHRAARCRRVCFFLVLVFQDQGKDGGGLIVHRLCYGS